MRLLLDTNVLIDYFAQREPFCLEWEKLDALQMAGYAELWASAQSFNDAFYVLRGAIGSDRLQEMFFETLSFVNVCPTTHDDVREAARRSWPDFEDCMISLCAEAIEADYIVTRDANGFAQSRVPWCRPDELFARLERDKGTVFEIVDFPDCGEADDAADAPSD